MSRGLTLAERGRMGRAVYSSRRAELRSKYCELRTSGLSRKRAWRALGQCGERTIGRYEAYWRAIQEYGDRHGVRWTDQQEQAA